ncbi:hypothetical protein DMB92_04295 [Campylobacter sp. MIT 99-7217]|uniref:hypothetical protein n=1 Tax=Campylobacter sp. MIT 99-7217 TaxID=535091 RepID=UPI00115B366B|nr:hypothetical protein [Campylobacter sp. MIT 99-7217]TQR32328.1 hypothetical protein DMB92_04295 [Campylobacter sp. MIT 99-7217]
MTKLYGIMQYLGECEETKNSSNELTEHLQGKELEFNLEKYKAFKPLSSKNGIQVLRGFADSKTLSKISKINKYYQRKINEKHKRDIEEYLIKNSQEKIYFPEVTLLYEYDPAIDPEELPIKLLIHELDGLKDVDTLSRIEALGIASFTIQDNETLYRLDGNHRLEVLGEVAERGIKKEISKNKTTNNIFRTNRLLSFCIIFVAKTKESSYEHLYFYLLNSKALPIDSLKTLDIVTKADEGELKEFIQNDRFLFILNKIKKSWIDFSDDQKDVLISVLKEMLSLDDIGKDKYLCDILEQSMGIYHCRKHNFPPEMLGVICFLRLNSKDSSETEEKLSKFEQWINKFNYNIKNFKNFTDLHEAFIKYYEELNRTKYIFVAMECNEDYINTYRSAINNVIYKFKGRNYLINFELRPIMEQKSDDNIPDKISKHIEESDIIIIDISTNNTNVMFEYGLAKALDKHIILTYSKAWRDETLKYFENIKNNKYLDKIKKDLKQSPFDIRANNQSPWEDQGKLEDILEKEIMDFINKQGLQ